MRAMPRDPMRPGWNLVSTRSRPSPRVPAVCGKRGSAPGPGRANGPARSLTRESLSQAASALRQEQQAALVCKVPVFGDGDAAPSWRDVSPVRALRAITMTDFETRVRAALADEEPHAAL